MQLHISVRNLVEFIFRSGDIDNRVGKTVNTDAMMEGTRIHKKIQNSMDDGYMPEVPLKYVVDSDMYELTLEGRADGIFEDEGINWIDEIKGMYRKVEFFEEPVFVHKAQAMCYAYIFATLNNLDKIGVQMTYCNLDEPELLTKGIKRFREIFGYEKLKQWFDDLIGKYRKWADIQCRSRIRRQDSIKELQFPFEYRVGQKKLVEDVYRTILRQKTLFLQAPTGVGKTISTIFPAVKAVGEELADRIFYLTAKTITASVAIDTFNELQHLGYHAKIIQLTAKEKLCLCEEMDCNPVNCPYAKGHFDRVNDAVFDLLQRDGLFDRDEIIDQAEKFHVCPFEMSLDTAIWCDDIICDYNYLFDPNVYLKRFFQEGIKGDYIFLVDEAHNLVERSRSMYSAGIYKEDFLSIKKIIKPYSKKIEKLLEKCNTALLGYKRECEGYSVHETIGTLAFSLMRLSGELDEFLQKPMEFPGRKDVLDFYFRIRNFLNIYELVDEHYVIYSEIADDGRFMLRLMCVDPSQNVQRCLDKGKATIFFSATFLPIDYYKKLLSTKKDNYAIYAQSTFVQKNRLIAFANDVSTKYSRRTESEYRKIADYINKIVSVHKGNYMVFFPSYKFMENVRDYFNDEFNLDNEFNIIAQTSKMSEEEREKFLERFNENSQNTLIAFCVMGGIFGEGIDLKNEKLIGTIIVGTGLPQISNEKQILKEYYDDCGENGFDYAFRYPGINKVLQAAGRVIRTAEDYGVIILLDERFLQRNYEALYPREWNDRKICSINNVEKLVTDFWKKF